MIKKFKGYFLIAFIMFLVSCHNNTSIKSDLNINVFKINNGWGYKINIKNKTIIYQPCIPVITGNEAFHSKSDALKAGEIVLYKITQGQLPVLTRQELINAGISI
jgi:hypothetical protein